MKRRATHGTLPVGALRSRGHDPLAAVLGHVHRERAGHENLIAFPQEGRARRGGAVDTHGWRGAKY